MHLVIGRLSDHHGKKPAPDWMQIREIQVHMAETRPHSAWVDTDDLNDVKDAAGKKVTDDLHYTQEGYELFGKRRKGHRFDHADRRTEVLDAGQENRRRMRG